MSIPFTASAARDGLGLDPAGSDSAAGRRLEARGIEVHFEGLSALDGVDLDLFEGEVLGLIGPNGAGKTTFVNVLTGFQEAHAGTLRVHGDDTRTWSTHRFARRGIVRTFQSGRYFGRLTVRENVEAGPVGLGMSRRAARPLVDDALERMGLVDKADRGADALSHGEERRLGIARAIAMRPEFMLLDEPAAGLDERESLELVETIAALPGEFDCGVLVIEHDMHVIMRLCHRLQVLDHGKTIAVGGVEEVRRNQAVIEAYLGAEILDASEPPGPGGSMSSAEGGE